MSTNIVNLDALIPREDFAIDEQPTQASGTEKISIIHLEGPFFGPDLRKPDFQRETNNWTPNKVADLIRSFVDGDLIPAVILWRAGKFVFVIDGAHRLGALIAWIRDDYGDRRTSLAYFGGIIPQEQRDVADKTRTLVNETVGPYQDYLAYRSNPEGAPEKLRQRVSNLAVNHIIGQWVPRTDKKSAEASFFKINQSATPIDATEKRILKARRSASALAARAITHGGRGHKYWIDFDPKIQASIEADGDYLYRALYDPPMGGNVVTTLDVPVAGRGYNTLPFIFDLVNEANDVDIADTTIKKRPVKDVLPDDPDGTRTLQYLHEVKKRVQRITTKEPRSLGLHPVVYFYTRSGAFQTNAFLAASRFIEDLAHRDKLKQFRDVRLQFEDFLIEHKEAIGLVIHKFGSGGRNIPWIKVYYDRVMQGFVEGKTPDEIQQSFVADPDFTFLTVPRPSGVREQPNQPKKSKMSDATKTASFFSAALPGGPRCAICRALMHRNSITTDHKEKASEHGRSDMSNAQPTHPYCNSSKG